MKRLLVIALSTTVLAGSAFAADPVIIEEVEVVPAVYNWTGFYVGASVGYGWSQTDWTYAGGATADHSGDGVIGGGQVGFNWQTGMWVFGVEADIMASGVNGSTSCPNPVFSCESEVNWLGSARLRAGVAANNWLFYATGGVAFGEVNIQTVSAGTGTIGTKQTRTGWAAGGGVEWGMTQNLTLRTEYLYYDLGSDTYTVDAGLQVNADVDVHTVRVGINFKF